MNRWLIALAIAFITALITITGAISQGRIIEMGITSSEMAQFFQQHAGANDIARVDHPNDIGLISNITVGRKMVIFKSASQIEQFLASNAGSLDIIGYNLEPGQQHDPAELADPVGAAKRVRAIAAQYGKQVAIGLTHDLTIRYGAQMASYADIWVLQIQRAQNDPQMAGEFVNQMVPALKRANPAIQVFVQIRTDSSPQALVQLVNDLGDVNVSILTQRQDVSDAIAVAAAFFGGSSDGIQQQVSTTSKSTGDYGYRLRGKNRWLLPVATTILGSDEEKHLGRGSVNAWDLVAPEKSLIYAMAPGTVSYAGCNNAGGYGCWVLIDHADGFSSEYGHMIQGSIRVQQGQQVDQNTILGQVGWTGKTSFGPHTHFEIRKGGQFLRIDQFFDISQMKQCNLCSVKGVPVAANGIAQNQSQQPAQQSTNRLMALLQVIAETPQQQLATWFFAACLLIGMALWLGGLWVRVAVVGLGSGLTGALIVAILLVPITPVQATSQQTSMAGGDTWETIYPIIQSNEGWGCTNDGAYTMGGVTQGTFNRWRNKHGLGNADVCKNLTREQAKQIYYELFFVPSGAINMDPQMALTVVDHYINTGTVKHLLDQCGTDVACFNQARIADYQSKGNCYLYCQAWINRVNKIRKYTGG